MQIGMRNMRGASAMVLAVVAAALVAGETARAGGAALAAEAPSPPASALALGGGTGGSIAWLADFEQAIEQAEILRRPVMIDVWARWCRWCHELDRRTYSHADVIRRAEAMTSCKVNADRNPQLGARYGIRGLPTILFLDRHGREINRVTGFVQAAPFAQAMDQVAIAADLTEARAADLRRDPNNPARIYAYADELLARARHAEAEPLLARLSPAGSDAGSALEPDAVLDLAVARLGKGDPSGALDILAGFLDAYPASPRRIEAELRLGQLLLAMGEREAARPHLEAVAGTNPPSWKAAEARRLLGLAGGGDAGGGGAGGGGAGGSPATAPSSHE